jgi:hypothetical protein
MNAACSPVNSTCETMCPATGTNPMSTFCTCVDPPGSTEPEYACVRIPCTRDAGMTTDSGSPFAACPANVRNGTVDCNANTDSVCQTACTNMMQFTCVCMNRTGATDRWTCAQTATTCQ